ncbi:MAG: hypothetical protein V9E87_01970 [Gemmatimonadales bacterium]
MAVGRGPVAAASLLDGKDENHPDVAKFRDYFDYDEPIGRVPSHRALAVFRGRALEMLDAKLVLPGRCRMPRHRHGAGPGRRHWPKASIALHLGWSHAGPRRPTT